MSSEKPDRNKRLAEALRANLRRRKGQSREWAAEEGPEEPAVPEGDGEETR